MSSSEDTAVLLFQLKAAEYNASGSHQAFVQLVSLKPNGQAALLSEVAYDAARRERFAMPWLAQLVRALTFEERETEAALYCDRWIELAPDDLDAFLLRVVIACRTFDLPAAQSALDRLNTLDAPAGMIWGMLTMSRLAFTDGGGSLEAARAMLVARWRNPMVPQLAVEAAIRGRDPDLIVAMLRDGIDLAEGDPNRWQHATYLFREHLLALLRARRDSVQP